MSRTRHRLLVALAAAVLALTGCATVPDSSDPVVVGTVGLDSPGQASLTPPVQDQDPDLLACAYVTDSAQPGGQHDAARQYLTEPARQSWDDAESTTIVSNIDCLDNTTASTPDGRWSILLRGDTVGTLSGSGVFTPVAEPTTYTAAIELQRVDEQWRIDELPDGVVMRRSEFEDVYRQVSVYFLDPALSTTVPDPRWVVRDTDSLAATLVDYLLAGPSSALAPAVVNELEDVSLAGNVAGADSDGAVVEGGRRVRVPLEGLTGADEAKRDRLVAQIVWTLDTAGVLGPYFVFADGSPLLDGGSQGWNTSDVALLDPSADAGADVGLHAVLDGALVDSQIMPVTGALGGYDRLLTAALSPAGERVAAVARVGDETELLVGRTDGAVVSAARGDTMTRPTWTPDGASLWVVQNGGTVLRVTQDPQSGDVSTQQVDLGSLGADPAAITSLRLSRDGVRAALVVGGEVVLAEVTRTDAGTSSLVNPQRIAPSLGTTATTLDWTLPDTLIVARTDPDNPVVTVTVDGATLRELPDTNLSAPVRAVAGSPTRPYVADNRGVLTLTSEQANVQEIWRQVEGLGGDTGPTAIPVLPG